jgi:hypothetical protein
MRFVLLTVLAATAALAADKPNLSGSWKMDVDKSDFGGSPPPESFARKIEHSEPALIFTDDQTSALGSEKAVRKYTTDGKETTYNWMGGAVKSAAHWEGNVLVIVGKVDANGAEMTVTSRITLSTDGKTLTESDELNMSGSELGSFKLVLGKQ